MPSNRREVLLIVGMILIAISLVYYLDLIFGLALSAAIYIGVKFYVRWKKTKLGMVTYVCNACGNKFTGNECSKCGSTNKKAMF